MEECGKSKNKCKCLSIVFGVLIALFLGVIGTIIGTVFAEAIFSALQKAVIDRLNFFAKIPIKILKKKHYNSIIVKVGK